MTSASDAMRPSEFILGGCAVNPRRSRPSRQIVAFLVL